MAQRMRAGRTPKQAALSNNVRSPVGRQMTSSSTGEPFAGDPFAWDAPAGVNFMLRELSLG